MSTVRVLPPASGLYPSITVNGRTYSCPLGSVLDVPVGDATAMIASNWIACGSSSGPTTSRPSPVLANATFFDSTLGYIVVFDGQNWRNPATGGVV